MQHPLDWLPQSQRRPLFFFFLLWALLLLVLFQFLNQPLTTPLSPAGIISLQLAGTPARAGAILDSWDSRQAGLAAFGLGFDYLFMPVYAAALALGALLAAGRHPGAFARLGGLAAWLAFSAAALDALENLGQFNQVFHARLGLAPAISLVASLKFIAISLALTYGLVGWMWKKK